MFKFSVGSCCCNDKKPDSEKCNLDCSGGTCKYVRGTYQTSDQVDIWKQGKIEADEFFTDKQLPKMPLYYPDKTNADEKAKCYMKNATDSYYKPTDVVQWRLRDSNNNVDLLKGVCRSWVPVEEEKRYPDKEGSEKTPVVGINITRKPIGCKSLNTGNVLQHIIFIFDSEPYLQVFYRETDRSYVELPLMDQQPASKPVCWDGYGNFFVFGIEEHPYLLRY